MSYDSWAYIAKFGGTLGFVAFFIGVIVYTFWPKNKDRFEKASHMPLEDDDTPLL